MSGSFVTPTSELGVVKRVKTHTNPRSWYSRKEVNERRMPAFVRRLVVDGTVSVAKRGRRRRLGKFGKRNTKEKNRRWGSCSWFCC